MTFNFVENCMVSDGTGEAGLAATKFTHKHPKLYIVQWDIYQPNPQYTVHFLYQSCVYIWKIFADLYLAHKP